LLYTPLVFLPHHLSINGANKSLLFLSFRSICHYRLILTNAHPIFLALQPLETVSGSCLHPISWHLESWVVGHI
jgi:hypothetical protein